MILYAAACPLVRRTFHQKIPRFRKNKVKVLNLTLPSNLAFTENPEKEKGEETEKDDVPPETYSVNDVPPETYTL